MSTDAKVRGAVGCVCDSNVRDYKKIMEMNFPFFCNRFALLIAWDVEKLSNTMSQFAVQCACEAR